MKALTEREWLALKDAAERPGGWGLFKQKSTESLATLGYFVKDTHQEYGAQWRITGAGGLAYKAEKARRR